MKHNWIPLCSDINTPWWDEYYWWKCANCKKETEHTKISIEHPPEEDCESLEVGTIFPLSSI